MFLSKEKKFIKLVTSCLDDFCRITNDRFSNMEKDVPGNIFDSLEKISASLEETVEILYNDAYFPVLRGHYLNLIFSLSNAIPKFCVFISTYKNSDDKIKKDLISCFAPMGEIIEVLNGIGKTFNHDILNIKIQYNSGKTLIRKIRKCMQPLFSEVQNAQILLNVSENYLASIEKIFNAFMSIVVTRLF